jgi:hypothetical protein
MEGIHTAPDTGREHPGGWEGTSGPTFLEALIDPINVFRDPRQVVEHPWFTDKEKRTILLFWARDEFLVEQIASKVSSELAPQSRMDAVLQALSEFDAPAAGEYLAAVTSIRGAHERRNKHERMH